MSLYRSCVLWARLGLRDAASTIARYQVPRLCLQHQVYLLRPQCCLVQVQSGVARTGKWWGHQHMLGEDEQPDIMTFAKGIAAGFPFAGLAMKDSVKAVRNP